MLDEATRQEVRNYLHFLQMGGVPVSFGVSFGGGKGDLAVVVVSPAFERQARQEDLDRVWKAAGRLVPIPIGPSQWENDSASALLSIARQEGEKITL